MTGVFGRLALGLANYSPATPTPGPTPTPTPTPTPSNTRANSTMVRANHSNFSAALEDIEQQLDTLGA